jgi:hypothetical protein
VAVQPRSLIQQDYSLNGSAASCSVHTASCIHCLSGSVSSTTLHYCTFWMMKYSTSEYKFTFWAFHQAMRLHVPPTTNELSPPDQCSSTNGGPCKKGCSFISYSPCVQALKGLPFPIFNIQLPFCEINVWRHTSGGVLVNMFLQNSSKLVPGYRTS